MQVVSIAPRSHCEASETAGAPVGWLPPGPFVVATRLRAHERCPSAVLRSECDRCATARRIYLRGRTFPTEIALPSGDDQQEGWGYVILCNVLSGSGYRLRATGEIEDVSGAGSLLARLGAARAETRRTGPTDGRFRRRKPGRRADESSMSRQRPPGAIALNGLFALRRFRTITAIYGGRGL